MTAMFKVQNGVPIPAIDRTPKATRRKFPVEGMQRGQMFFVPDKTTRSVSAYVSRITRDLPGKYSARHVFMRESMTTPGETSWELCEPTATGAVEGVGVWRIE